MKTLPLTKPFFILTCSMAFSITLVTVFLWRNEPLKTTFIASINHLEPESSPVDGKNVPPAPCPCQISHTQQNSNSRQSFPLTDFSESLRKAGKEFWNSLKPGFTCPKSLLKRVPEWDKGAAKWTCGLSNLGSLGQLTPPQPCVVYSFGVGDNSQFEAAVLQAAPHCHVYAYDPTVNRMGGPLQRPNPQVHFSSIGIGGNNTGSIRTLKTLMEQNGGHRWIDILKIDTEGAEYASLNNILDDFNGTDLPFGQLLMEVHVWEWGQYATKVKPNMPSMTNVLREKTANTVAFFKRLESRGLRMFNFEVNMNDDTSQQCCSEVSFINMNTVALNRFLGRSTIETDSNYKEDPKKSVEFAKTHQLIPECDCFRKYFYPATIRSKTSDQDEKRPLLRSTCSDPGTFFEPGQKVVSMCLWFENGYRQKYSKLDKQFQKELDLNLQLMRLYYPGYSLRVYTDLRLTKDDVYCKFSCENPDLFWCNIQVTPVLGDMRGAYFRTWRFLPLGDETVDHFLSRDLDSLISAREQAAVEEWLLNSTKAIHIMRDHYTHHMAVLGGMWGASNSRLGMPAASNLSRNILSMRELNTVYGFDQKVLQSQMFQPRQSDIIAHDSYHCTKWGNNTLVRPFPTQRNSSWDFVGRKEAENRVNVHKCPKECRPFYGKDWENC